MRQLYLFLSVLAMVSVSVACSKTDPDQEDPGQSPVTSVKLSDTSFVVDAKGGEFSVYYSISNPVEGLSAQVMTDDEDWITSLNAEVDGVITFSVEQNEGKDGREGKIVLTYASCSQEIIVCQEGHGNLLAEEIIGVWNVLGDRWDLDNGTSVCYLMDDDSEDGYAHDEDGNYITITIREFCEQYAEDYNADENNPVDGTPEDFADKLYEDIGLAGTFEITADNVVFTWGLSVGFSAIMVDGVYEYNTAGGYMTVTDNAIPSDPRNLQIDVFQDEDGRMCFRYPEYYITSMYSYDKSEEYWIYAPTIFYCEKSDM